ncbi:hypothetical protein ACOME3_001731 [Neoechinorhynchus agilis]
MKNIMSGAWIVTVDGNKTRLEEMREYSVGRAPVNDFIISNNPSVSRWHVLFTIVHNADHSELIIRDKSTLGVWIDNRKVDRKLTVTLDEAKVHRIRCGQTSKEVGDSGTLTFEYKLTSRTEDDENHKNQHNQNLGKESLKMVCKESITDKDKHDSICESSPFKCDSPLNTMNKLERLVEHFEVQPSCVLAPPIKRRSDVNDCQAKKMKEVQWISMDKKLRNQTESTIEDVNNPNSLMVEKFIDVPSDKHRNREQSDFSRRTKVIPSIIGRADMVADSWHPKDFGTNKDFNF